MLKWPAIRTIRRGFPSAIRALTIGTRQAIFEGFKRYEAIVDSPYNGFQLCLGTTAEGLKNPAKDVLPIVQYLGKNGENPSDPYAQHSRRTSRFRGGLS